MSCKFNKRYVSHLLIGETWRISLYDLNSKASIFTIPVHDLVSLDWHSDPAVFGGLGIDGRWWLWSMERNPFNIPQHQGQAVPGSRKFQFVDNEGTFFCISSFHGDTAISVYPNGYTKGLHLSNLVPYSLNGNRKVQDFAWFDNQILAASGSNLLLLDLK